MIGVMDVYEAIVRIWDESSLNAEFLALRDPSDSALSTMVLHDQEAAPGAVFPYCVMELGVPRILKRVSGTGLNENGAVIKRHSLEYDLIFNVHAEKRGSSSVFGTDGSELRSPKQVCGYLMEKVMEVFGGHPTIGSSMTELTHGQFQGFWPKGNQMLRTEQYHYKGFLKFGVWVDVPVAV